MKLPDVALPDAQGEDLDTAFPQSRCDWPRIPAIRVAVCNQEDHFGGIGTGVA